MKPSLPAARSVANSTANHEDRRTSWQFSKLLLSPCCVIGLTELDCAVSGVMYVRRRLLGFETLSKQASRQCWSKDLLPFTKVRMVWRGCSVGSEAGALISRAAGCRSCRGGVRQAAGVLVPRRPGPFSDVDGNRGRKMNPAGCPDSWRRQKGWRRSALLAAAAGVRRPAIRPALWPRARRTPG